jgi:cathepsin B
LDIVNYNDEDLPVADNIPKMKFVLLGLLIASALSASHPVNHEIVAEIKANANWIPMEPEENPFAYMPVEDIKAMMGTKLDIVNYNDEDLPVADNIPKEFDGRKDYKKKAVHDIRDQQQCGSCWAFGATEALSDRFTLEKGEDVVLSPQHLVSCDRGNFGCNGGYLNVAWNFMKNSGVASDKCYPYTSGSGSSGTCKTACADGSAFDLHFSETTSVTGDVAKTQTTIMNDGPVEAAFQVYQDFMNYKSGVYEHKSGSLLGGHAIKCIGWGTENGVDYWLMANSWGTKWGDKGFFKIKRGDCGINQQMTFSLAH